MEFRGSPVRAEAVSANGLRALGLPESYPAFRQGKEVSHAVCQRVGEQAHAQGLRGIWCRSVCTPDGRGRELAWFPATGRSKAKPVWFSPLLFGARRDATGWADPGLEQQKDPA
jgi:hypothetical protein